MTTEANGAFVFTGLSAEPVTIEVSKKGFELGGYGTKRPDGGSLALPLVDGENANSVVIRLWPYGGRVGAITGVVRDDRGRAVAGVHVRAVPRVPSGEDEARGLLYSTSDLRGMYRIEVPAGTYLVQALVGGASYPAPTPPTRTYNPYSWRPTDVAYLSDPTGLFLLFPTFAPPGPDREGRSRAYATTFHGGDTPATARAVAIARGEVREGIDIVLTPRPGRRIRGTVNTPRGTAEGVILRLIANDVDAPWNFGHFSAVEANSDADGRFDFVLVADGAYRLHGYRREPPNQLYAIPNGIVGVAGNDYSGYDPDGLWLRMPFVVDRDRADVEVPMRLGTVVSISVVDDDGRPIDERNVGISWQSQQSISQGSSARSAGGGIYRANVSPGRYVLSLRLPQGTIPSALRRGSRELTDQLIDVGEDEITDLVLSATRRPALLTGTVVDERGQPPADATIVLFPADRAQWPGSYHELIPERWRSRAVRTQTGSFAFAPMPPGDYLIAAVDDSVLEGWPRAPTLGRLARIAAPITLTAGAQQAPVLRLR